MSSKSVIAVVAVLGIGAGAGALVYSMRGAPTSVEATAPSRPPTEAAAVQTAAQPGPAPQAVGVDALMASPERYAGLVAVEGVVGKVFGERRAFTLIDVNEVQKCGTVDCAEVELAVIANALDGTIPASTETVTVVGQWRHQEDGGWRLAPERITRADEVIARRRDAVTPP